MKVESLFFYIWIVLCLYLSFVYLCRVYNRNGKKKKRHLFIHVLCYAASFVPVVNLLASVILAYNLFAEVDYYDCEIRSFMFKKF